MPSISFMAFLPSPWPWPVPSLSSYKSSYAAPSAPSGSSCHSREPKRFVGEPPWPSFNHSATRYKWESNITFPQPAQVRRLRPLRRQFQHEESPKATAPATWRVGLASAALLVLESFFRWAFKISMRSLRPRHCHDLMWMWGDLRLPQYWFSSWDYSTILNYRDFTTNINFDAPGQLVKHRRTAASRADIKMLFVQPRVVQHQPDRVKVALNHRKHENWTSQVIFGIHIQGRDLQQQLDQIGVRESSSKNWQLRRNDLELFLISIHFKQAGYSMWSKKTKAHHNIRLIMLGVGHKLRIDFWGSLPPPMKYCKHLGIHPPRTPPPPRVIM